ncbi:hypothetical protein Tco_0189939 [Tanacetum coccineum]
MKEVFDQMEAEVDQHAVDKKFSDMHDAYTAAQKRVVELEAENSNLKNKIQNDDHDEMIKHFSKLEVQGRGNTIRELKEKISRLSKKNSEAHIIPDFKALDYHNKDLTVKVNALQDLNERFRVENEKVKQHYKELYDSIKITRAKTIEKTTSLLTEIENLKAQLKGKIKCVTMPAEKPKVLAPGMYAMDVESIPPRQRNNREVHLDYIRHLKESVEALREIIEEARVENPLDTTLHSACIYTKHSQELLEYVIGTCLKEFSKRDKKIAIAPLNLKKRVTFVEPCCTDRPLVFGLRLLKTYDEESLTAQEFPIYFRLQPAFQSKESMSPKRQLFLLTDNMAKENIHAPTPTRSDDQILPFNAWVPIRMSNCVLDIQKKQRNLIFQISFWNTLSQEAKTGAYRFQLDEDWFTLDANLLRQALEITLIDQAQQFVSPPSGDAIMDFVNELGYPEEIHFVSRMAVNNLYQPWRAILQYDECTPYYNAYLEMVAKHDRKTAAEKRGKMKSGSKADQSKKPATAKQPKPVPSKPSKPAPAKKPKVVQEKPLDPSPAKQPKKSVVRKVRKRKNHLQLIDEEELAQPQPDPELSVDDFELHIEQAIQMSLKSFQAPGQAPVGGVTIRECVAEATRQLPVTEGKGKGITTDEQAALSLLDLHKPKKKSTMDQFIF